MQVVWTKGEGEFDFDYLLNLTSSDFVNVIANRLDQKYFKSVKVLKRENHDVEVIVVNTWGVRVYTFHHFNKSYESTAINNDDLGWALEVIKSGN